MYDIVIIGAGPAGLTAALYALRANKKVLILEANCYGGQIINASNIENYPSIQNISGFDYATNLYNQVKELGAVIKYEKVIKINSEKEVITNKETYLGKTIIIATGTNHRKLNLDMEDKLIGKGVSYCATCDGNFYKDKIVAVVGGGNTALTDVIYLSDIADKVYLIHRRDTFRGEEKYLNEIKSKDNVEIIVHSNVVKLNGEDYLESIEIQNIENESLVLNVNGLFVAIGQVPQNECFKDLIELDDIGYVISDDGVHTSIDGIYVAGDIIDKKLRQLVTATSDGAIAATVAIEEMR